MKYVKFWCSHGLTDWTFWLSSRNLFRGRQKYCYANFYSYANFSIVLGPNFRGANISEGATCLRGVSPPSGRKPDFSYSLTRDLEGNLFKVSTIARYDESRNPIKFLVLLWSILSLSKAKFLVTFGKGSFLKIETKTFTVKYDFL